MCENVTQVNILEILAFIYCITVLSTVQYCTHFQSFRYSSDCSTLYSYLLCPHQRSLNKTSPLNNASLKKLSAISPQQNDSSIKHLRYKVSPLQNVCAIKNIRYKTSLLQNISAIKHLRHKMFRLHNISAIKYPSFKMSPLKNISVAIYLHFKMSPLLKISATKQPAYNLRETEPSELYSSPSLTASHLSSETVSALFTPTTVGAL